MHFQYLIARHLSIDWLAMLPRSMQLRLLDSQPAINRVIRVDIERVVNLNYPELRERLNRDSFRFDLPLAKWEDTGESHHLIRELKAGVPSERTEEYRLLMAMIERGERPKGITNRQGVLEYIGSVEVLMETVRRTGLRTPRSGSGSDRGIQVCIDENGRLCKVWGGGTHRYGIVREFGLGPVPIYVRHAHGQWLARVIEGETGSPLRAIEQAINSLAMPA